MKKLIVVIVIILFLISGCSITISFSGLGNNSGYDLTDRELSSEIIGFDGRLALENILSFESSISKTGFYIDGNLTHENDKLGILHDSLIIGDTLYLAFDGRGIISLNLNNPDFEKIEKSLKGNEPTQVMKLVSDGTNVFYIKNNQICRIDKDQKETCTDYQEEETYADVLELYQGNLYVSISDNSGKSTKSKLVKIDPKTLKVSSTSNLDFGVSSTAVVGDVLYIDTGEEFGVYENGKLSLNNINNYVYKPNTNSDDNENSEEYEEEINGILKMKTVGDKLLVATNEGGILSIDPKQNHKVTELVESGHIMSVNGNEAYISDLSWEGNKNILKYDSQTNKAEYINYVDELNSDMYLFY